MRDTEIKLMALAAVVLAGAMYLRAKKGAGTGQPAGAYWDGYGWMQPGMTYTRTW